MHRHFQSFPNLQRACTHNPLTIPTPLQGGVPSHQRVQLMMSRILAMQWNMPPEVQISPECKDLLSKLLVANPQQRLTMQQVNARLLLVEQFPNGGARVGRLAQAAGRQPTAFTHTHAEETSHAK